MLERAIDMGMSFEQALELISSGKGASLLGGRGAGKGGNTQVCAAMKYDRLYFSGGKAVCGKYFGSTGILRECEERIVRSAQLPIFPASLATSEYVFTSVFFSEHARHSQNSTQGGASSRGGHGHGNGMRSSSIDDQDDVAAMVEAMHFEDQQQVSAPDPSRYVHHVFTHPVALIFYLRSLFLSFSFSLSSHVLV